MYDAITEDKHGSGMPPSKGNDIRQDLVNIQSIPVHQQPASVENQTFEGERGEISVEELDQPCKICENYSIFS